MPEGTSILLDRRRLATDQRSPRLGTRALARRRGGARRGEVDGPDAVRSERRGGLAMSMSRFLVVLASVALPAFSVEPKEKVKLF